MANALNPEIKQKFQILQVLLNIKYLFVREKKLSYRLVKKFHTIIHHLTIHNDFIQAGLFRLLPLNTKFAILFKFHFFY